MQQHRWSLSFLVKKSKSHIWHGAASNLVAKHASFTRQAWIATIQPCSSARIIHKTRLNCINPIDNQKKCNDWGFQARTKIRRILICFEWLKEVQSQGWRDIYQVIDITDIYLISIKQEINVDFLISCVVWNISLAMRLCATALSVIDLCALIQNLVLVSTVLKCLVDRNWVQKLKKNSFFATVHWIDELMWSSFFCHDFVLHQLDEKKVKISKIS